MAGDQGGGTGSGPMGSGLDALTGRLSMPGELLVALGAVVVLAVDIIGDIIAKEFFVSSVAWAAALVIILGVAAYRWGGRGLFGNYSRALTLLGLVAGAIVARDLIDDIRYDLVDGGKEMLFAIIYYVGGALLLVGAWLAWSGDAEGS